MIVSEEVYCYCSAILASGISHYHLPLDEQKMARAAQHLLGEHDFTSFRAYNANRKRRCAICNRLIFAAMVLILLSK